MKPGTVVYKGKTAKGLPVILRYPKLDDTSDLLNYINTLSSERTFIRFQGEQQTYQKEKKYLSSILRKIKENKDVHILAFSTTKLIGKADIRLRDKIDPHVGDFGLTVAKNYRAQGLGKLLIEKTIEGAKKNIPGIKIISLGVFGDNKVAISLYKKRGFLEYGRLPKGVLRRGKLVDHVYMYKILHKPS